MIIIIIIIIIIIMIIIIMTNVFAIYIHNYLSIQF